MLVSRRKQAQKEEGDDFRKCQEERHPGFDSMILKRKEGYRDV
jgi:hypothetical protein